MSDDKAKCANERRPAPICSARDIADWARMSNLSDACMSGDEYASEMQLPIIPEKWNNTPELRESWITGFLVGIRNRIITHSPNE